MRVEKDWIFFVKVLIFLDGMSDEMKCVKLLLLLRENRLTLKF